MRNGAFVVHATWDEEVRVWVAESDDVPGLITEAANEAILVSKLRVLIPELLQLNDHPVSTASIDVVLQFHREERISLPVAA
jgi:hypothetical protein